MEKFIFDLDGTILKSDYKFEARYFREVLSKEDADKFIPKVFSLLMQYEDEFLKYDIFELSSFLTEKSGVNITEEIIKGWIQAGKSCEDEVFPGVVEVLEYLKSKNKKIVLLTNWFTETQVSRLKKMNIFNYFDEVYGADLGYIKPRDESYKFACGDTPLEKCVMIGDSLEKDVLAPLRVGMDAVYFDPTGKSDDSVEKVINNIIQIKEMY